MTREEAINEIKSWDFLEGKEIEAIHTLIPELKESEDERIRKDIIALIKFGLNDGSAVSPGSHTTKEEAIAYLEKQKEQKPESCDCSRDEESYTNGIHHVLMNPEAYGLIKQKPAEWSEEDEKMIDTIVSALGQYIDYKVVHGTGSGYAIPRYSKEIDWLKSLRPVSKEFLQPQQNMSIGFMLYLDEHRPEGKMSLSNAECEDIDKAFKENDWAKIMRYVEKYQTHWKPSEEQMDALKDIAYGTYQNGDGPALRELYEQLKKLI